VLFRGADVVLQRVTIVCQVSLRRQNTQYPFSGILEAPQYWSNTRKKQEGLPIKINAVVFYANVFY